MSDIWNDPEAMDEVFSQLTSEDWIKLMVLRLVEVDKDDDGSTKMKYYNMGEAVVKNKEYPETAYSSAEILAHYESGDVIVINSADINLVNTVRADVGLDEEDSNNFGESGKLEVYALSCQKVNGLRNLFVYVVPKMGDLLDSTDVQLTDVQTQQPSDVSEVDLLDSQDETPEKDEVIPEEYTIRKFQIERWANFLKWTGDMGLMAISNAAFASEYKIKSAANDDLADIADAQTKTFDFSYSNARVNYSLLGGTNNYSYTRTRNNYVSVTIYTAHSFSSGKDYYVVQSETTTVPKSFTDTYIENDGYKANILHGYTRSAATEHHIDGGEMSVDDVSLIKHTPANINEHKSYTEGMQWGINGKVGVNKDGASAEIGGSVNFSKSVSWSVSEYKLINDSMKEHPASAKWYIDVNTPSKGSRHYIGAPLKYYTGVNATAASVNQIKYDTYFMWEVGKNYWQNHSNIKMNVKFNVEDGFCMGKSEKGVKYYDRYDYQFSKVATKSLTLNQPTHTAVSKKSFGFNAAGASSAVFNVFAEDNWTIKDIPSWIAFTHTSGSATGSGGNQVLFDVKANTTGAPRKANLTLTSGRDTVKIEIAQTGN